MNSGKDVMQIYHTHPAGYAQYASKDDMNLLGRFSQGTKQRYSRALPLDGPDIVFSKDIRDMSTDPDYYFVKRSNGYQK